MPMDLRPSHEMKKQQRASDRLVGINSTIDSDHFPFDCESAKTSSLWFYGGDVPGDRWGRNVADADDDYDVDGRIMKQAIFICICRGGWDFGSSFFSLFGFEKTSEVMHINK